MSLYFLERHPRRSAAVIPDARVRQGCARAASGRDGAANFRLDSAGRPAREPQPRSTASGRQPQSPRPCDRSRARGKGARSEKRLIARAQSASRSTRLAPGSSLRARDDDSCRDAAHRPPGRKRVVQQCTRFVKSTGSRRSRPAHGRRAREPSSERSRWRIVKTAVLRLTDWPRALPYRCLEPVESFAASKSSPAVRTAPFGNTSPLTKITW